MATGTDRLQPGRDGEQTARQDVVLRDARLALGLQVFLLYSLLALRNLLDHAWAVEAALQLKEKAGQGEVTVLSLGPNSVQETIRKALSMGADRGVHLKADTIPFDGFAIASALAAELKDGGYDLIFFGKMSPDSSNGIVGPIVAELLGLPCVTAISQLELTDSKA